MTPRPLVAIVLAAGLGKRMRSELPKVLHPICGRPLIDHVLNALEEAGVEKTYVVIGHGGDAVRKHLEQRGKQGEGIVCVEQTERLGTGHAVMQVAPHLSGFVGDVLVTCGDAPLLTAETFRKLIARRQEHHSAGIVLSGAVPDPKGYGRIVRRDKDTVHKIVEDKDCTEIQRKINEVNTGTYCFDSHLLFESLREVKNDNQQGEYYLTDVIEILVQKGKHAFDAVLMDDWTEMLGINSRAQLAEAAAHLRRSTLTRIMDEGVTIVDPQTTQIEPGVMIGPESTIEPFTILRGTTTIGAGCRIGPFSELIDAKVGHGAIVRHALVERAEVAAGATVGPFAHVMEKK